MYRRVIEVLKWTEARTVLKAAPLVSKLWLAIAVSEELWTSLREAEDLHIEDSEEPSASAQACYQSEEPSVSTFIRRLSSALQLSRPDVRISCALPL